MKILLILLLSIVCPIGESGEVEDCVTEKMDPYKDDCAEFKTAIEVSVKGLCVAEKEKEKAEGEKEQAEVDFASYCFRYHPDGENKDYCAYLPALTAFARDKVKVLCAPEDNKAEYEKYGCKDDSEGVKRCAYKIPEEKASCNIKCFKKSIMGKTDCIRGDYGFNSVLKHMDGLIGGLSFLNELLMGLSLERFKAYLPDKSNACKGYCEVYNVQLKLIEVQQDLIDGANDQIAYNKSIMKELCATSEGGGDDNGNGDDNGDDNGNGNGNGDGGVNGDDSEVSTGPGAGATQDAAAGSGAGALALEATSIGKDKDDKEGRATYKGKGLLSSLKGSRRAGTFKDFVSKGFRSKGLIYKIDKKGKRGKGDIWSDKLDIFKIISRFYKNRLFAGLLETDSDKIKQIKKPEEKKLGSEPVIYKDVGEKI